MASQVGYASMSGWMQRGRLHEGLQEREGNETTWVMNEFPPAQLQRGLDLIAANS
jgi:hypothetical protein